MLRALFQRSIADALGLRPVRQSDTISRNSNQEVRVAMSAVPLAMLALSAQLLGDQPWVPVSVEDLQVFQAVLEAEIRPEITRMRGGGTPVFVQSRTISICRPSPSSTHVFCLPEYDVRNLTELPAPKKRLAPRLGDRPWRDLVASFAERNADVLVLPLGSLTRATVVPPGDAVSGAPRPPRDVRFSLPGYSADGHAIIYASYLVMQS
jgi:hypothetical protein